jgi:hypothetical protein
MIKLLTLSDGFGDINAVPPWYPKYLKWPEIIRLMTKHTEIINFSRYGAGNEYLTNQLRLNVDQADVVLIQWAQPNRLDLVLSHQDNSYWPDTMADDPIYNNNIVTCGNDRVWLSSGSTVTPIKDYHARYISDRQHQMRSQIYIDYAKLLLEKQGKTYGFMLVEDADYISSDANWIWHKPWKGMTSFRHCSQYCNLELGITQPIPLVVFDFIKQFIMPTVDLSWRNTQEIDAVENMLYRHYQESIKNKPDDSYKKFNS